MGKLKDFMDSHVKDLLEKVGKKEFTTTDVIYAINQSSEWQKEYIRLSEQYGSYNKLNAQVGRYLANNREKLKICKNGNKEICTTNTGRRSPNQKWSKL